MKTLTDDHAGRTELTYAIIHKDTALALELLKYSTDPNHTDHMGFSDLCFAAQENELEVLKELLRMGADPNGKPGGAQPLLAAMYSAQLFSHRKDFDAYERAFEMVKALLEAGADPDLSQSGRPTARQNAKYLAPGPIAEYMKAYPARNDPKKEGQ